jgi:hypothetical protein
MKQHKELLLATCRKVSTLVITITTVVGVAAGLTGVTAIHSTIPANGDVNPYGVFRIPRTVGRLTKGNILVSNFNNSSNSQGTGTTLVQISPSGSFSLFAQIDADDAPDCPGGIGLTTALVVLRSGWVVVGSLPTKDGTAATAKAGCLLVLNSNGKVVETIFGTLINGPWDMTVFDGSDQDPDDQSQAMLFATNVLNGTVAGGGKVVHKATVVRVNLTLSPGAPPFVESLTVIGSGFAERTDPAALVIGPTGVALSPGLDVLYVADSLNNRIAAIPNPLFRWSSGGTGFTVSQGRALNDPLGMTLEPSGDILTANGNDGFLVETTPDGRQVSKVLLDNTGSPPGAGTLFGLTLVPGQGVYFVDDGSNTLNRFH